MALGELFGDPADTREELMAATYQALCEHGYADLTIQRISDQFLKSKSLLYHHYDSKDELLVDFLGFVLDHLETTFPQTEAAAAVDQLASLLDQVFPTDPTTEQSQFLCAIIELRTQAATDTEYQAQFDRTTQYFHERFVEIIERGISERSFRAVDAEQVASLLVTTLDGAMLQEATTHPAESAERLTAARSELDAYIERRLLTADGGVTE